MSDPKPNLDSLFEAAVEIESAEERAAFLGQSCGGDLELRKQVELLLQSDEQAGSFLNQLPAEFEATILTILTSADGGNLAAALDAGLVPAFTAEQAVVLGDGNHSVLKMLGQTLDKVPRVALRESAHEASDPILKPKSAEMPQKDSDSRYQLQGEIARGGMGAILKGRDTDLGRDLAIKVLLDAHKDKPEIVQRFIEEAQIGGQLQHPGVAPIYELGQFADKRPFFAMKLVKGETLSKLLASRKEPAAERGRFVGIFEQICQTMAYAHSRGVIHRDLKPANIMVGAFGEVQVMDWGLAKVLSAGGVADEKKAHDKQQGQGIIQTLRSKVGSDVPGTFGTLGSHTQMGSVMGTPAYMPPEQAHGEIDLMDERADVFGLGAILCEILTGKPPYVGDDGTQVYRMASRGKLDACFSRLDTCEADAELIALAKHCLELEPCDRPRDAGALVERVTGHLASVESRLRAAEIERAAEAARAKEALRTASAERRARRLQLTMAAVVVGLATLGGIAAVWSAMVQSRLKDEALLAERKANTAREAESQQRQRAEAQTKLAEAETIRAEAQSQRAEEEQRNAERERDLNRRNLYFAQMQLAQQARGLVKGMRRMTSLLDPWQPQPTLSDLRGWEWYYLKSLEHTEQSLIDAHRGEVRACAWSPDGKFLATGGDDLVVRISNVSDGQVSRNLDGHTARVTSVSWRPDGSRLVSASEDQAIRIWNAASGECISALTGHGESIAAVAWSHDGKRIASGSREKILIWDSETGEVVRSLQETAGESLAWMPDDTQLIIQGGKFTSVWTVESGDPPRRIFQDSDQWRSALALSPNGQWIATPNQSEIRVRDLRTGEIVKTFSGHKLPPLSLSFSPDGQQLASAGGESWVSVWDLATGAEANIFRGQLGDVWSVSWHPNGKRLASASNDVRVWNTNRFNGDLEIRTGNERTFCVVWSSDGQRVATAGQGGQIEIRDAQSGDLLRSMPAHEGWTEGLAWHPHQPWLASSGRDDRLRVWNSGTGELLREIIHVTRLRSIDWSSDGKRLAVCGQAPDGEVILLDSRTWEVVGKLSESDAVVTSVKWNHDGTRIAAVGSDLFVRVWDTTTLKLLARFPGATTLAWSTTGNRLATTAGPITIWDTAEWKQVAALHGHTSLIYSLDWNADDTRLVSASQDSTAILWDTTSHSHVLTLRQGRDQLHTAAWDPDSRRIASVDSKGFLHLLDARPHRGMAAYGRPVSVHSQTRTAVGGHPKGTLR